MQYLSQVYGPKTDLSPDAIQGAFTGLAVLLVIAFFLISRTIRARWSQAVKIAIVCMLSFIIIVLPAISDIMARRDMGIQQNGSPVSFAHDGGVLQTEAAVRFMLHGVSPYSADYHGTGMEEGVDSRPELWKGLGFDENPAFKFYPYPPFTLVLSAPFYVIWKALFGWYDQRILHILALIALAVIGYKLPKSPKWKLPMMSLLILSPISALFFILGMNDILCLTFLMASFLTLTNDRYAASGVLLGLACGLKQFAWIMVPFYLVYLYAQLPEGETPKLKRLMTLSWPLFASAGIVLLPFFIWDPKGFIHSLITAQSTIYPFRSSSLGFSNFLILFHWIDSYRDRFPAYLYYIVFVLPVMLHGLKMLIIRKSMPTMIVWYTVTLFLFLFFSRNFAHNYLGFLVAMIGTVYALEDKDESDIPSI